MPAQVKKLDAAAERHLAGCLTTITDHVAGGASPDDAICKVAEAEKLPAGHVSLVVRAYNTGRSLGQIRQGQSTLEKAATVPLADVHNVLSRLYPDEVKTAAEMHAATAIADDYQLPPTYWLQRRVSREKAAATLPSMLEKTAEAVPQSQEGSVSRVLSTIKQARKQAEDAHHARIAAGYASLEAMEKLANYFCTPGHLPFAAVRDNAVAVYGARAAKLLDATAARYKQISKQAADMPHTVDWTSQPYSLLKECLQAAADYCRAGTESQQAEKQAAEVTEEQLRPFVGDGPRILTGSVWADPSSTKEAGNLAPMLGAGFVGGASKNIAESLKPPSTDTLVQQRVRELATPEHENALRDIREQAMLHDLIINDPIISGYDPDQVADAFSRISELAPQAAQQRLVMQNLLRKYLEQGQNVDLFDQQQLLGMERQLQPQAVQHASTRLSLPGT